MIIADFDQIGIFLLLQKVKPDKLIILSNQKPWLKNN